MYNYEGCMDTNKPNKKIKISLDFPVWINKKYAEWVTVQPPSKNNKKYFAQYLGISSSMLSGFFYGTRLPSKRTLFTLSLVLGNEIYKELGVQEPKQDLAFVINKWKKLSDSQKREILHIIGENNK
jgi:transcriptional regulator with XRE-family HTH domain